VFERFFRDWSWQKPAIFEKHQIKGYLNKLNQKDDG
jgi:hypothetical protein